MFRQSSLILALAALVGTAQAQQSGMTPAQSKALIRSALAAAPANIAAHATVMAPGADGKMVKLRDGTNGFTCFPDDNDHSGAACADAEAMKWMDAYMAHAPKPTNSAPGVMYMLAGGIDASATDPYAKLVPGKGVASGPHWMLMWPASSHQTGLASTPKRTGTWIMWDGTPYAHLMINQKP